jgi:hypothetical protein
MEERFKGLSYHFYLILADTLKHVPEYSIAYENFQYKNFLIVRDGESVKK